MTAVIQKLSLPQCEKCIIEWLGKYFFPLYNPPRLTHTHAVSITTVIMLHHNPIRCRRAEKACRLCCADEMRSVRYRNPVAQELHCADNALLMQLLYRYLMAAQVPEHMQRKQWCCAVCWDFAFVSLSL